MDQRLPGMRNFDAFIAATPSPSRETIAANSSYELVPFLVIGTHQERSPFFKQIGCRAMGFQGGRVDHQSVGLAGFSRKCRENSVEDTQPAPANEAAME